MCKYVNGLHLHPHVFSQTAQDLQSKDSENYWGKLPFASGAGCFIVQTVCTASQLVLMLDC